MRCPGWRRSGEFDATGGNPAGRPIALPHTFCQKGSGIALVRVRRPCGTVSSTVRMGLAKGSLPWFAVAANRDTISNYQDSANIHLPSKDIGSYWHRMLSVTHSRRWIVDVDIHLVQSGSPAITRSNVEPSMRKTS